MQHDTIIAKALSQGLWLPIATLLFICFAIGQKDFAAVLILVSGIGSVHALEGHFRAYHPSMQLVFCGSLAAISFLFALSAANNTDASSDQVIADVKQTEPKTDTGHEAEFSQPAQGRSQQIGDANAEPLQFEPVGRCSAIDGDTLNCSGERIRLLGIDAPEMSRCAIGRVCVDGNPIASRTNLFGALGFPVYVHRVGTDQYGRTLAAAQVNGRNLSCLQWSTGNAEYVPQWDDGGIIAAACYAEAQMQSP